MKNMTSNLLPIFTAEALRRSTDTRLRPLPLWLSAPFHRRDAEVAEILRFSVSQRHCGINRKYTAEVIVLIKRLNAVF